MISHVSLLANVLFTLPSAVTRLAIPVAGSFKSTKSFSYCFELFQFVTLLQLVHLLLHLPGQQLMVSGLVPVDSV